MSTTSAGSRKDIQNFFMKSASLKSAEGGPGETDNMATETASLLPPPSAHQDNDLAGILDGKKVTIASIYAPNENHLSFLEEALLALQSFQEEFYKSLYSSINPSTADIDQYLSLNLGIKKLDEVHSSMMERPTIPQEVTEAICRLKNNKSAGPDGYRPEF
ncbi:UNVERIFIED_CONTAM: hypothetical protein K2H54_051381 [Gekko kuhli]